MRTITIEKKIAKFDELNDEQKRKVLVKLRDINVDYEWWDFVKEDPASKSTIKEINGRFTCTKCGYEWSAMLGDDEIPETCECER